MHWQGHLYYTTCYSADDRRGWVLGDSGERVRQRRRIPEPIGLRGLLWLALGGGGWESTTKTEDETTSTEAGGRGLM